MDFGLFVSGLLNLVVGSSHLQPPPMQMPLGPVPPPLPTTTTLIPSAISSSAQEDDLTAKPFYCTRCNRRYKYKTSLWNHQRYECGIAPQFECPVCKMRCSHKGNLRMHIRRAHKDQADQIFNSLNQMHLFE